MSLMTTSSDGLTRRDVWLVAGFCLAFFGISLIGGRPLTMHEGVLPQSAREMARDHDWVVPKNGGRPWLESPPLPQWITVAIASCVGRCDAVWIVRIGPALMATAAVLLVAWMGAAWFGRAIGVISGLALATMYEFAQYAWLAEDEIFLCTLVTAAVAWFVKLEMCDQASAAEGSRHFLGRRPWSLLGLFLALGLTNLAKGLLFGTVMALVPIAAFLLWNRDWRRISFYFWFWGWLAFAAIAAAWPIAAYLRYPDVLDLWLYDHKGRLDGGYQALSEPFWYYAKVLPGEIAPWTLVALVGLWLTRRAALFERYSPARFLWGWAWLTPIVFSIPTGKHHHYMLHCLAPWAVLTALGLTKLHELIVALPERHKNPWRSLLTIALPACAAVLIFRHKLARPEGLVPTLLVLIPIVSVALSWALSRRNARVAATALFATVAAGFAFGHWYAGAYADQCREDTVFLQRVRERTSPGDVLLIDTQTASLDEFRLQFYLPEQARPLHNLSFLADQRLAPGEIFVITRAKSMGELARYGQVDAVLQSVRTRRERSAADRWTLFRVVLKSDLPRFSTEGIRISPMQAAQRADGPFLGTVRR